MKLLDFFDTSWEPEGDSSNVRTMCLWCGRSDTLSISTEPNHQFQCWNCKEQGNAFSWIRKYYELLPRVTPSQAVALCRKKTGLVPPVVAREGLSFCNSVWYIPVRGRKGNLLSLHKYNPSNNVVYSSPSPVSFSIIGLHSFNPKLESIVICEGHWDYLALLSTLSGPPSSNVIGCCGSSFPARQLDILAGKHIYALFDNDDAGKNGIDYLARKIKESATPVKSLNALEWSKLGNFPPKYDVRDFLNGRA